MPETISKYIVPVESSSAWVIITPLGCLGTSAQVSPASVTIFEVGRFGATLVKANETGSLAELVPPAEA